MPMNSMPRYMAKPKAAQVAITADTLPISPSQGFDLTASPIIQVITLYKSSKRDKLKVEIAIIDIY